MLFISMVTQRDRIWDTTLRVGKANKHDITVETVQTELSDPPSGDMIDQTLQAMWELGTLRCQGGGGRNTGIYRLNPGVFD